MNWKPVSELPPMTMNAVGVRRSDRLAIWLADKCCWDRGLCMQFSDGEVQWMSLWEQGTITHWMEIVPPEGEGGEGER